MYRNVSVGMLLSVPQRTSTICPYPLAPACARLDRCPQVQGVLAAAGESWPHIHISDSLVMADAAVKMAQAGCTSIAVLGVDFMSENVRAILDEAGLQHVKVGLGAGAT